jgi:chaperonin GroES
LIATKYKGPRVTLGPFLSHFLSRAINNVTREEDGEPLDSFALTAGIFFRIIQYYHLRVRRSPMKLRPLHDWAVILPSTGDEMTAGGLYIPDTAKVKPQEGVVEAVGPGAYEEEKRGKKKEEGKKRKFIPTTVKPGDHVLYERYAGQTYKINGEERILVRERDILGILSERPLQIPSMTAASGTTALTKPAPPSRAEALKPEKTSGKMVKKPARRAASKPSPKKKAAKKAAPKAAKKKASAKSTKKTTGSRAKGGKTGKKK